MKRYLLFISEDYYPEGAQSDFQGDFDTLNEAKTRAVTHGRGFADILDTAEGSWTNGRQHLTAGADCVEWIWL